VNFTEGLDQLGPNIGERLRRFREEHGLSQGDVADMTGIARESICRYEKGTQLPSLLVFVVLVRYMDAGAHWMLFGSDEEKGLIRDRRLMKVFLAIQALDPDSRRWFMDLAAAFLQNGDEERRAHLAKLFDEL